MTEKRHRGIDGLGRDIAQRKRLAAEARLAAKRGEKPAGPAPRDVFLAACEEIGRAFSADGFVFRKGGPKLVRKRGELTDVVQFQSSHHNVAGKSVTLVCHVHLESQALARWREKVRSPFRRGAYLGGGQIGNLRKPHEWIAWNLARRGRRDVGAIVSMLRDVGLPLLEQLGDADWVARAAAKGGEVPGMSSPYEVVEFLLAAGRERDAARYLRAFLDRRPATRREAAPLRRSYEKSGVPARYVLGNGWADEIAALQARYRLG